LDESKADVAKIDCEGAEVSLVTVPKETLRKIPTYFVETHSPAIRRTIERKFTDCGFRMRRAPQELAPNISMLFFEAE
jgi:hypothetical protein